MRVYLATTLAIPIIDLYDFIYGTAGITRLRHLDVAYNDLMRSVVGVRRSARMHIVDLCAQTGFNEVSVRRDRSQLILMTNVTNETTYSHIRQHCVKSRREHSLRVNRCIYTLVLHARS
jgi:hypothetical protein